jgi:DNA-binding FadR family transcriptional regulator
MKLAEPLPHASDEVLRDHPKSFGAIAERNADRDRAAMLTHLSNVKRYWCIANGGLTSQDVVTSLPKSFNDSIQ